MKKTFLFVLLMCCFAGVAKAQNIQLHYDLGRAMYNSLEDRPWVTTTVEMFKADKWGSTFFWIYLYITCTPNTREKSALFQLYAGPARKALLI